jgi:hypothetical protein
MFFSRKAVEKQKQMLLDSSMLKLVALKAVKCNACCATEFVRNPTWKDNRNMGHWFRAVAAQDTAAVLQLATHNDVADTNTRVA